MSAVSSCEVEELRLRVSELERELSRARGAAAPPSPSAHGAALGPAERDALLGEAERTAQMGTWVWDLARNTIAWSKQLFRILGYDPERDVASFDAFFGAVHPDDLTRIQAASQRAIVVGELSAMPLRFRHRDGAVRECLASGVAIYDQAGTPVRMVGVIVDFTGRRRAERELGRSERMLREAQRVAQVGSWVYDLATRTIDWSEELFRIFGVNPATPPTFELFCRLIHPEDRQRVLGGAESSSPLGIASPVECRIVRASDGEVRHVQMASQLITDEAGGLTGLLGTGLDITERRHLEEQLLHSQKLEAIGRLAGGVAHDFNNMLTAIFGNTELASRKVAPASPVFEHLSQIRAAADRAAGLTRQLLAFARRQIIQPTVVDPNALVLGVESLLRPLVGEHIALEVSPTEDIWPIRIDRGQFEQLLINLAVNARDAMQGGGRLTITTANITLGVGGTGRPPEIAPGDYVELVVTDTGHGMDSSIQPYVFEPFFTTKEAGKGAGLGLATCHGIVRQHGGTIWFDSASGQGTRFNLYFPRVHGAPDEALSQALSPALGGDETVLVVEDEPQVRELCVAALRSFGYSVLAARNGKETIALAAAYPDVIHLLLSDVVLPDVRAPELCAAVRLSRPALPVLYTSGYTDDAIAQQGVLDPGVNFLQKPYTPTQLAKAVRRVLDAAVQVRRPPGRVDSAEPDPAPIAERLR